MRPTRRTRRARSVPEPACLSSVVSGPADGTSLSVDRSCSDALFECDGLSPTHRFTTTERIVKGVRVGARSRNPDYPLYSKVPITASSLLLGSCQTMLISSPGLSDTDLFLVSGSVGDPRCPGVDSLPAHRRRLPETSQFDREWRIWSPLASNNGSQRGFCPGILQPGSTAFLR